MAYAEDMFDIFRWPEYLQPLNLTWDDTAPPECFNQSTNPPVNHFQPEYHLKVKDPHNQEQYCLAEVLKTEGPRICLQLKFTSQPKIWRMCDAADISPLDGSDMVGVGLQCPTEGTGGLSTEEFQKKLRTTLKRCQRAPPQWFVEPPNPKPEKNLFRKDQKLEVVDQTKTRVSEIWPGTIDEVKDDKITVKFDGYDQPEFNQILPYDSRDIFPCGWAERAHHPMCWSDRSTLSSSAGKSAETGGFGKKSSTQGLLSAQTTSADKDESAERSLPVLKKQKVDESPRQDSSDESDTDEPMPKLSAVKSPRPPMATKNALGRRVVARVRAKYRRQEAISGTSDVDKTEAETVTVEPQPTASPRAFGKKSMKKGNLSALAHATFVAKLSDTPNDNDAGPLRLDISSETIEDPDAETDVEHNRKSTGSAEAEFDPIEADGNFSSFSPSSPPGIDDKSAYSPGSSTYSQVDQLPSERVEDSVEMIASGETVDDQLVTGDINVICTYSPTSTPPSPCFTPTSPSYILYSPSSDSTAEQQLMELPNEHAQDTVNMMALVTPNTSQQISSAETVDNQLMAGDWRCYPLLFYSSSESQNAADQLIVELPGEPANDVNMGAESNAFKVTAYVNGHCKAGKTFEGSNFRGGQVWKFGPKSFSDVFTEIVEFLLTFLQDPNEQLKLISHVNSVDHDYTLPDGLLKRGVLPVFTTEVDFWSRVGLLRTAMGSCHNFISPGPFDHPCVFCDNQPPNEITKESSMEEVVEWLKQFHSINTAVVVEIFQQKKINGRATLALKRQSVEFLQDRVGLELGAALELSSWLQEIPDGPEQQ